MPQPCSLRIREKAAWAPMEPGEMRLWWSKWLQQSPGIRKGQGYGVTQRALRMGSEKMKGSFVEPLKNIFPKLKRDTGENETQGALVTNFQVQGRFCWTFCYWVIDDALRDASKSFENTEWWHMWDVVGESIEMEPQKDCNDQDEARALCSALQQHLESCCSFLKAWVRDGKLVRTPADGNLGWLAVPVARKGGVPGE